MTKTELCTAVAIKGVAKAPVAVNAVLDVIAETLKKGEDVVIPGFGSFKVVERAARKGLNPHTKEVIDIPARKAVTFKASKGLI